MSLRHSEIEHQAAMRGETRSFGEPAHFLHQSRLANSRFAADIHDLAAAACKASGDEAFELIEFGFAPNKGSPVSRRWIGRDSAQAPDARGCVEAFERDLAKIITKPAAGERA